jgi:hypothetical protein
MTEREKVIEALEACVLKDPDDSRDCRHCPRCNYGAFITNSCINGVMADALSLLKEQELRMPRVMTLEEVKQHNNQNGCVWFEQPTYNAVAAFVRKDEFEIEVISPYILGEPINHGYWLDSNYNVTWRCWTSRPDQATREATPWN